MSHCLTCHLTRGSSITDEESVSTEVQFPHEATQQQESSHTGTNVCVCVSLRSVRELLRICAGKETVSYTLKVRLDPLTVFQEKSVRR